MTMHSTSAFRRFHVSSSARAHLASHAAGSPPLWLGTVGRCHLVGYCKGRRTGLRGPARRGLSPARGQAML